MSQHIYSFGAGGAEGRADQKELLGGKGAGLAEMSGLGIPVPAGFTITTEVCSFFHTEGRYPDELEVEFAAKMAELEERQGRKFGAPQQPLLLSVRSGGPVSMPGMMDTILNLGLNDAVVEGMIAAGFDARFAHDCYRRLLTMYGDVVLGVPHEAFEQRLAAARHQEGVATDPELSAAALAVLSRDYLELIASHGTPFPEDPYDQLWGAIGAVFESWNNTRARQYRRLAGLSEESGTGVNVQAMVFGNAGLDCATGVAFTRNPADGEARIYGEFLVNAQGEDVVAGIRTPRSIEPDTDGSGGLGEDFPQAFESLVEVCGALERHRGDMQDVEFTIEGSKLYMLQTRDGKRTGPAAVRIAYEMVRDGRIDAQEGLRRVAPQHLEQMLAPVFDLVEKQRAIDDGKLLTRGLGAGPGAASGAIAFTSDRAAEMALSGAVLLVRAETSPEDIVGMHASTGILTSRGGMTSHAAVVARGLGKPCIVGAGELAVDEEAGLLTVAGQTFREGDRLSIDGSTGEVLSASLAPRDSEVLQSLIDSETIGSAALESFLGVLRWADDSRRLRVRTNADTPHDAAVARALGAEGIGLCRTEHMFFEEDRIAWIRQVIFATDDAMRQRALNHLLPVQENDFYGILRAMDGLPVTIRLLDPPLHEFLPHEAEALDQLATQMELPTDTVRTKAEALAESNPMLGHRGCRLGLTTPDIYRMQVDAITRAAARLAGEGLDPQPEIMVPLVGTEEEMIRLRLLVAERIDAVLEEASIALEIPIGTMIEVPRAALVADRIAGYADFFSFGTNDLTQMTYGYSRDDVGKFLPEYVESGVLACDPFESLDRDGVGQLVRLAYERGLSVKADLKVGICGEHGGDPSSVEFFHQVGLDYVSCSPYRIPIARLAAGQARLAEEG